MIFFVVSNKKLQALNIFKSLRLCVFASLWLSLLFLTATSFASIQLTDDNEQTIVLQKPATRIISLAPNITEILFSIGAGEKIVGTSIRSDYPDKAGLITVVSDASHIQIEKVIALYPDLIVAWQGGNAIRDIEKLMQLKIPVYFARFSSVDDISKAMRNLGKLSNTEKSADTAAQSFQQQFSDLKNKYSHQKKLSVFYIIWQNPVFTVNQSSVINEIINLCGGKNVFANTIGAAPEVNIESVLAANPQVIMAGFADDNWKAKWRAWPQITAVKNNALFSISPDLLHRFSPRIVQGAKRVCEDLELERLKLSNLVSQRP